MELVINTYGSYLQKNGDLFRIKTDDKVFEVSSKKISSILISTGAYITTDAIKMAMDNNIDIVLLDEFGTPFGRVWHSKLGSTTLIRRKQLEISTTKEGLSLALEWIKKKFTNQVDLLRRMRKKRPQKSVQITNFIGKLESLAKKLDLPPWRENRGIQRNYSWN